ncbi:MgtC/SapB family protein [Subsaximicrobium wynnwilliamsii]|uniref:MgtC/SapB family protein n=1 Tax=Subsaximicrobium wynnwilliamsii TaxID=291179 RepID=A0A5C6ZKT1_9FLAO|nr:MgtC/SapB family protein [Subsaximicrobium wynnwilliamsii]TXD85494.1 MgtC/SapB family protein [Subsaximicrobium wynnwilliamsii]TXD90847.1 MgtC/SapB family protein [Subsaximicrobium wynnwilliamsii]TXE05354.1 MgtC/SapB family protein [Subsaximicrobium wynnwilliamsii]
MNYQDLTTLGIALGLGLLVGLQRERTDNHMAGVRTFMLISILGVMAGFLAKVYDNPYILPVLGLAIAGMLIMANYIKLKKFDEADVGQTTEVAVLLMFVIGAYLVLGNRIVGVLVGASMAILLYIKEHLHGFIEKLKPKDLSAIMTLVGISLIILPILPDKTFGPFDVLNPRNIWLMVTLIVGISVFGYFIYKFFGRKVGVISNGILGGLISSTATTVSYARKTSEASSISKLAVFVITTASAVSFVRILFEVGVVIPDKFGVIALPIAAVIFVMALICVVLFYFINTEDTKDEEMPEPENPAQFKSALIFGLLYGFILLAVAFTKETFGNNALYIVSIVSGLTDVDAITLSLSQLIKEGSLEASFGWKLILLAGLSNMLFKGIMAIVLGAKSIAKWIAVSFGITIATGLLILWLWPESWYF